MFCPTCGKTLAEGTQSCPYCGASLQSPGAPAAPPYTYTPPTRPYPATMKETDLPPQYRPLGMWAYFGYSLLFSIPIVGFILLIVFSCSRANINRRNFARSYWCWLIIAAIIAVIVLIVVLIINATRGSVSYPDYSNYYSNYYY
ncbi:MAG: zinc ribbon domain-containing protein [Clostridia bacterium]|nr:zinc ribbon domain-containing protein [Clostridia bacterium]